MSKIQQKKKIKKLSSDEEAVAKRVLNGKEKIYRFDTGDEAIASLHKSTFAS